MINNSILPYNALFIKQNTNIINDYNYPWKVVEEHSSYTVSFNANGGTCNTSTLNVTKGSAIGTLPTPSFSKMGFAGWYTAPYGGTQVTESTVPTGDMTLYAHYYNNTSKITFNTNGVSVPGPVLTGNINGVNIGRPGESLVVFNRSGETVNTNIYGVEVAVDANGKVIASRDYGDENKLTVPSGGFVLSGQAGWDSENNCHVGGCLLVWDILSLESDAYISLNYETGRVNVYNSHNSYLINSKRLTSGEAYGVLPTLERPDYIFDGWYTSASGGTEVIQISTFTSAQTLYAHWTSTMNTVSLFDAAGTVWKTGSCVPGASYTLPETYPTMEGRYFSGWVYKQGTKVFDVRPGDVIPVPGDIALYPVYVTHEEAVSGKPVFIYNIEDFPSNGYDIHEELAELKRETDSSYWTDWSEYSTAEITPSDTVEVRTTAMYRYYYYLCSKCGDHNPLYGGCGCGGSSTAAYEKWSTIPYSKSNYATVSYATYKCVTTSLGDGQMWYFSSGNANDTAIGTVDADSSAVVIKTGYSSRTYKEQTSTETEYAVAYVIRPAITFIVPNNVTRIEEEAFAGNTAIVAVELPSGVKSIGARAFQNCSNMTMIVMDAGVTDIAADAFVGCSKDLLFCCPAGSYAQAYAESHGFRSIAP